LEHWQADKTLTDLSNRETQRFESAFQEILVRKRNALLLRNHIERLGVILAGFGEWVGLNQDLLAKNADSAAGILKKIKMHQQRLKKIKTTVKKTLSGAMPEVKNIINQEVHRFFDSQSGSISQNIANFIDSYALAPDKYQQDINHSDFSQILYLVFQDFKQAVDAHITEVINPDLIRFVQSNEKRIEEYFESLILPFDTMMEEAYEEFNGLSARSEMVVDGINRRRIRPPKMEAIIKASALRPPALITATHYSARIKAEAIVRLGYYKALQKSKTIFKKNSASQAKAKLDAMEDALRRMRRETAKSVVFHLKDYRENLKFRYFFKLVEAVSASFAQTVLEHFQVYFYDLAATLKCMGSSQDDKENARQILDDIERTSRELVNQINRIRGQIEKSASTSVGAPQN
jgi:hypothetical protein